ncbi:hypothetical protein LMG10661_01696 [Ralstonia syzygii subsp. syzygii]|nr:hypothetical protein LMG10661_01696 [Ralstonia syzygii subsp. syzygii]
MNNQTLSDDDIYRIANRWCPAAAESKQAIKLAIVSALREARNKCGAAQEAAQQQAEPTQRRIPAVLDGCAIWSGGAKLAVATTERIARQIVEAINAQISQETKVNDINS